jgi:REP element-mobilizing transposase RayT
VGYKKSYSQLHLSGLNRNTESTAHGGEHTQGKRKSKRPFDPKQALHVVLRSSKARGEFSKLHPKNCNHVKSLVSRLKQRWGIRVYRYANVGNHLHLLIRARSRADWQGFIRELSGGVAIIVTGAKKGLAIKRTRGRGFWDQLVFTRIVQFGRDFKKVAQYVLTNLWEGLGVPVRKFLKRGFHVLEISEDGAVLVTPDLLNKFSGERVA